jgi:uncharacterized protein (DUF2384 family)
MEERTKQAFETLMETTGGLEKVVRLQDRALDIFADQNKAERQARETTEKRLYDLIKYLVIALIATNLGKEVLSYVLRGG